MTVVIPHEVPAIQTVEKTVEVPQSQHLDRVVHQPSKVLSFQPSLVSLASVVGPSLAPLGAPPSDHLPHCLFLLSGPLKKQYTLETRSPNFFSGLVPSSDPLWLFNELLLGPNSGTGLGHDATFSRQGPQCLFLSRWASTSLDRLRYSAGTVALWLTTGVLFAPVPETVVSNAQKLVPLIFQLAVSHIPVLPWQALCCRSGSSLGRKDSETCAIDASGEIVLHRRRGVLASSAGPQTYHEANEQTVTFHALRHKVNTKNKLKLEYSEFTTSRLLKLKSKTPNQQKTRLQSTL